MLEPFDPTYDLTESVTRVRREEVSRLNKMRLQGSVVLLNPLIQRTLLSYSSP